MANIPRNFTINLYERVRDLVDGSARAEGIDLSFPRLPPEEIFYRFVRHRESEISEMAFRACAVRKLAAFRRCPNSGSRKSWANRGFSREKGLPPALFAQWPMHNVIAAWSRHW